MPDRVPSRAGAQRSITSLQNDQVKLVRSLDMRKARRDTGLFVAEGASLLMTARDNDWTPRLVLAGPGAADNIVVGSLLEWARAAGADRLDVSAPVLEKIAAKDNPQSVMAVFAQRWADLPAPAPMTATAAVPALPPLWIALEEVRDPGNLGTILRTADAAGASGVILVGATCDPFSREAVRASMGSLFAVPVARTDPAGLEALAAAWPGDVVGTHLAGAEDFRARPYAAPVLLVMGNEGKGLSDRAAALCRRLVRIPMAGRLDSLNLAVATALMLYEIRRSDFPV
jgi:TrmH family RNA methyltransferase